MPEKKDELLEEELAREDDLDEEAEDDGAHGNEDEEDSVELEVSKMTSDVPIQLVAVLGKKTVTVKELVELKTGKVIDLNRPANEMVDLVAGGKLVAKGELVDIDGKLGVRIVKMVR